MTHPDVPFALATCEINSAFGIAAAGAPVLAGGDGVRRGGVP